MNRITVDLGFGDSGKGIVVSKLAQAHDDTSLVVRYTGGCQSAHNVVLPDGRAHTFSQFGAATFQGVPTYIGRKFLFSPSRAVREAEELEKKNVDNPFRLLYVNRECLIVTPFHAVLNRVQEKMRGDNIHGSTGSGIGATMEFERDYPGLAVHVSDLDNERTLRMKMASLRMYVMCQCGKLGHKIIDSEFSPMFDESHLDTLIERYMYVKEHATFVDRPPDAFHEGTVIFEGSQGVLLDENVGFDPHTTWSNVTVDHALAMINSYAKPDRKECIFHPIIRSYMTRHGAGPLPTEDLVLMDVSRDPRNPKNSWAGAMRYGIPDFVMWRTALLNSGIPAEANIELYITHMDQMHNIPMFCNGYTIPELPTRDIHLAVPAGLPAADMAKYRPIMHRFPDGIDYMIDESAKKVAFTEFYASQLRSDTFTNLRVGGFTDSPVT